LLDEPAMTTPHTSPRRLLFTAVATLALVTGVGCAAKNKEAVSESVKENRPAQVAKTEKPAPAPAPAEADTFHTQFGPIFYALDSAQLLPESTATLQRLADYLRQNPAKAVTIQGHTCELGTSEYNLALGQKRAYAAKTYLTGLGVDARRVDTISFGEERPAARGSSEGDLSQNRRSEFDFQITDGRRAGR
jgi:peptidoglycan-associated lipoprotein